MEARVPDVTEGIPRTSPAFSTLLGLSLALWIPLQLRAGDEPADAEAAALAAIEKIGGRVRTLLGSGGDREVEFHLRGRRLTDAGLAHVAALGNVVSLNLRDTGITSAGLLHLKGLKTLRRLHLERTAVGDAGIARLAGLVELEYLNLYSTGITDRALGHLGGMKKLRRLYVWRTGVSDAGVARLEKQLPELKIVRGVDLSKLPASSPELDEPKPTEDLKWIVVDDAGEVPRSKNGLNTQVFFENKSGRRAKLYWKGYGGELKLYAELAAGATRQQNSYANNTWLITDESDRPLGYFIVGTEVCRAVIPGQAKPKGKTR